MSKDTTDLNPIDGYLLQLLGDYHRHLCRTCDGAENGCINCRNTGYNQTPCPICDKDGIAFKNRKDTLQKIESLISNREKLARIEELKGLPTPKVDEINMWSRRKAKMAHTKEAAWIEGARFMRNRVQAHKGKRIEALKQNSDQATIKSKGSL